MVTVNGWSVTVQSVWEVGPDMVALELDSPPGFEALPGQFVLIRATIRGESIGRHYTISSPDSDTSIEITVEVGPNGTLSQWLAQRHPGDTVWIEGSFGRIAYPGDGPVVVISEGPGVGGAIGVGERAVTCNHDTTIVHRTPIAHEQRLGSLSRSGAAVYVVRNSLQGVLEAVHDHGKIYVFGFRDFIDDVRAILKTTGVDTEEVAFENYGPRP